MVDPRDTFGWVSSTLETKYRIDSVVSRDRLGVLYAGQNRVFEHAVNVRCFALPQGLASSARDDVLSEFVAHGKTVAALAGLTAGIPDIIDLGVSTSPSGVTTPYWVLEPRVGTTLDKDLAQKRAQAKDGKEQKELAEAFAFLSPIADALSKANEEGFFHGSLRPSDIYFGGQGVVLRDFGVAALFEGLGDTSGDGTQLLELDLGRHGSPESFKRTYGEKGPWTDVFALALLFVELVVGEPALRGDDSADLYLAACDLRTRPTPRAHGVRIPDDVEAVLGKALAVDPKRRYATVGEFWAALAETQSSFDLVRIRKSRRGASGTGGSRRSGLVVGLLVGFVACFATLYLQRYGVPPKLRALWSPAAKPAPTTAPVTSALVPPLASLSAAPVSVASNNALPPALDASVSDASAAEAGVFGADAAGLGDAGIKDMVLVGPGAFDMGGLTAEELPVHRVSLSYAYYIDRTEVTTAAYDVCIKAKACTQNRLHNGDEDRPNLGVCHLASDESKADHPVNCIDYAQATAYCAFAGKRLPTEAEWEFAARGSDGRAFPWGNSEPTSCSMAVVQKACVGARGTRPAGAALLGASPSGALDMAGNVWEWVGDAFEPYPTGPVQDPVVRHKAGSKGILRGGSWELPAPSARATTRMSFFRTSGHMAVGFRCARDLPR